MARKLPGKCIDQLDIWLTDASVKFCEMVKKVELETLLQTLNSKFEKHVFS